MKVLSFLLLLAVCVYMGFEIWVTQSQNTVSDVPLNLEFISSAEDRIVWRPMSSALNLTEIPNWKELSRPSGADQFVEKLNQALSKIEGNGDLSIQLLLYPEDFGFILTGEKKDVKKTIAHIFSLDEDKVNEELKSSNYQGKFYEKLAIITNSSAVLTAMLSKSQTVLKYAPEEDTDLSWYTKKNTPKWFSYDEIDGSGGAKVMFKKRKGLVYGYALVKDTLMKEESVDLTYSIWDFQIPGTTSKFKIEHFPIRELDSEIISSVETLCECDVRTAWKSWNTNQLYLFNQNNIEFFGLQCLDDLPAITGLYPFIADKDEMYKGYQIRGLISGLEIGGLYADMFGKEVSYLVDLEEQLFFFSAIGDAKSFVNNMLGSTFSPVISPDIQEFLLLSPSYTAYNLNASENEPVVYQYEKQENGRYYHALWKSEAAGEFSETKTVEKNTKTSGTERIWERQMTGEISHSPFVFTNHYTKEKEILVITDGKRISLLNSAGKELWNRDLPEVVKGELHQVDLFRNNKFQVVFSTENYLMAIDRNGKDVENFPIKLTIASSAPVSVMDYDGKRKYRLLVPLEDGSLKNYNGDGKEVNGWKHKTEESPVISSVQHLIIGKKDYLIAAKQNGKIAMYRRDGKTRYTQELKLSNYNGNELFIIPSKDIEDVVLIYEDSTGNLIRSKLSLNQNESENLGIANGEKSLIYNLVDGANPDFLISKGTRLSLYNENYELKFSTDFDSSLRGALQCFSLNNKKYIVVNEGTNIYLLDNRAELYPGFPVYGSGSSVVTDLYRNGSLELITSDAQGLVICYELK